MPGPSILDNTTLLAIAPSNQNGNTWGSARADEIFKLSGFEHNSMLMHPRSTNLLYFLGSSLLEVEIHEK